MKHKRLLLKLSSLLLVALLTAGCGSKINEPAETETEISADGSEIDLGVQASEVSTVSEDTTAPTIELTTSTPSFELGDEFDYISIIKSITDDTTAKENITVDFEITEGDIEHAGDTKANITATDAAGNIATEGIVITVTDSVAPTLELKKDTVTSILGDKLSWQELVASVSDNDGEPVITFDVIEGDLDKAGYCTIEVTATDASKNSTSGTIKVHRKKRVYNDLGWDITGIDGQPYLVGVNRTTCQVTVYGKDDNGNYTSPVIAFPCSVGREGWETPTGRFVTPGTRYEWRRMIDDTYGRYATVISKADGILFHSVPYYSPNPDDLEWPEFNKLGHPASLGCIRMICAHAGWIFYNCPEGFVTIIYDAETDPIHHNGYTHIDESNEKTRVWDPSDITEGNPWRE
ncbi:MAG: L,D-transpeptidase [Lachnospiraceae bacterium]|nr:L,D-transpeptidase [Lachnospiraceae bacterium]